MRPSSRNSRQAPALNGNGRSGSMVEPSSDLTPDALREFHGLRRVLARRGWLEFTDISILETAARLHDLSERRFQEIGERGRPVAELLLHGEPRVWPLAPVRAAAHQASGRPDLDLEGRPPRSN